MDCNSFIAAEYKGENPLQFGYVVVDQLDDDTRQRAAIVAQRFSRAAEHLAKLSTELRGLGLPVVTSPIDSAACYCHAYGVALSHIEEGQP